MTSLGRLRAEGLQGRAANERAWDILRRADTPRWQLNAAADAAATGEVENRGGTSKAAMAIGQPATPPSSPELFGDSDKS